MRNPPQIYDVRIDAFREATQTDVDILRGFSSIVHPAIINSEDEKIQAALRVWKEYCLMVEKRNA